MRTAIFDLDGTLADTSADLIAAANAALAGHGVALDAGTDKAAAFGGGRVMLRLGLARLGVADEAEVNRLYPLLLERYEAVLDDATRLYDGVADCLDLLAASGWRLGVCTNKPAYLAEMLLERLAIRPMFGAVLGADSLPVRKPDPEHLRETIRRCGGRAEKSVLIGDTETDRATAANAGVACVLVTFGPEGRAVERLAPEALLDHFFDLPGLLARMLPA